VYDARGNAYSKVQEGHLLGEDSSIALLIVVREGSKIWKEGVGMFVFKGSRLADNTASSIYIRVSFSRFGRDQGLKSKHNGRRQDEGV